MRTAQFAYFRPTSVEKAVAAIAAGAVPLAGGQSLLQEMKNRSRTPQRLVDLGALDALRGIEVSGRYLQMGALTRHREIIDSPEINKHLPWLVSAARLIGDVQIRNRGTVGGNLCWADGRANFAVALLASNANVTLRDEKGKRRLPVAAFFAEMRSTARTRALLTGIQIPIVEGAGGVYLEVSRQPNDLALVNATVVIGPSMVAVALGGVAPLPLRLPRIEAALTGLDKPDEMRLKEVMELVRDNDFDPPPDIHATPAYRRSIARALIRRAASQALTNRTRREGRT